MGYYHVTVKINGINFHFTTSEKIKSQGHKLTDKWGSGKLYQLPTITTTTKRTRKKSEQMFYKTKIFTLSKRSMPLEIAQSQILFCKKTLFIITQ